jgi:hypothetical protein
LTDHQIGLGSVASGTSPMWATSHRPGTSGNTHDGEQLMTETRAEVPRLLYSAGDLATMLGISTGAVYDLMDQRALDVRWIGRRRLVTAESVEAYVASLPTMRIVSAR